jgi:hypothetical protein
MGHGCRGYGPFFLGRPRRRYIALVTRTETTRHEIFRLTDNLVASNANAFEHFSSNIRYLCDHDHEGGLHITHPFSPYSFPTPLTSYVLSSQYLLLSLNRGVITFFKCKRNHGGRKCHRWPPEGCFCSSP